MHVGAKVIPQVEAVVALEAGIAPADEPRSSEQWAGMVRSWWPGLVNARLRQTTWPQIEVHRDYSWRC